jgi:ribosomal protein S5
MTISTRTQLLVLVTAVVLGVASFTAAQTQEAPAKQQPSSIQGELVAVDIEAKTLDVMTAGGETVRFSYTDATEVVGEQEGIAGLATLENARVTVHFIEADGQRAASRIEVSRAADAPSQK